MAHEKITGFSLVSTSRYEGFDEQILSEFERIIQATYRLPQVERIVQFHRDLAQHLHALGDPHHVSIDAFFDALISQLFRVYREFGGRDTKAQMLLNIYKDIPRGSITDHQEGYRSDLSATAEGWNVIWNQHDTDIASHPHLETLFSIAGAPDITPTIYISTMFPKGYYPFQENPFDLTRWKSKSGTLVYDFGYAHISQEHTHGDILSLEFQEGSILASYEYQDGCTIITYQQRNAYQETVSSYITEQPFGPDSCNRAVITFDCDQCSILEYGKEHTFSFDYHELTPLVLDLKLPISRIGACLREVSYYPKAFPRNTQKYFLQ